jgi:hypothetical protein
MRNAIRNLAIASSCFSLVGSMTGCFAIGSTIGGAIDVKKYVLDSVSVRREVDSAGVTHRLWDAERLGVLARGASPGKESRVEILTENEFLTGEALAVDTLFAMGGDSADMRDERLLPGELVKITTNASVISGRVVNLNEKRLLLHADGKDREVALGWVNEIFLDSGRTMIHGHPAASPLSARLVRVPALILGQESLPLFIHLRDVEKIRVARRIAWGPARTLGFVAGGIIDFAWIYRLARNPLNGPSRPTHEALPLTLLAEGMLIWIWAP